MICHKVKNKFGFQSYKWQKVVIFSILNRFDVAVYVGISLGKNLLCQIIFKLKIRAIIFMILSIIALIKNQIDEYLILFISYLIFDDVLVLDNIKKKISVITLTSRNTAIDKSI